LVLRKLLPGDFYERREISQAVNIPASLLLALLLAIFAEFLAGPLASASHDPVIRINLPIGCGRADYPFSALLVAFENTGGALEAAWKFAGLTMMGTPIALIGFLTLFWSYHSATGGAWETWEGIHSVVGAMNPDLLKLSFLLVFVGFGAKSGLVPMHTWLPDAHSQAPTPVCAVLSGVKTTVPLYVILRFLSIILASPVARLGSWMVVLGLISVAIAALLLLQVRDYKRMFAFSTVEHMGIILTAAGLATQASDFGAVSQLLNHAITKSLCFYVAGVILLTLSTREIGSVQGLIRISPFAGWALLLSALGIAFAPPFPIFLRARLKRS
jgi:hydrogenase-4 component F